MMTLQLDMYQACALGAVVYALGRLMVKKNLIFKPLLYSSPCSRRNYFRSASSGAVQRGNPGIHL
jgi:hypothetical protein